MKGYAKPIFQRRFHGRLRFLIVRPLYKQPGNLQLILFNVTEFVNVISPQFSSEKSELLSAQEKISTFDPQSGPY